MAMPADAILQTTDEDNAEALASLGEHYYIKGDFQKALHNFERAFALDPSMMKHADMYAALLATEKKIEELECLTSRLMAINDRVPEPWIAKGYHYYVLRRITEAISFAHKAYTINPHYVEALLFKGKVLLDSKNNVAQEAVSDFAKALKIAPHRYEAHEGMVNCLLVQEKTEEAIEAANTASKELGQTSRTLTLHASTLIQDSSSTDKVILLLEEALKEDPTYMKAVYMLAKMYEQEKMYEKGVELLKKYAESNATCQVHNMLGGFLARTNKHEEALNHFSIAMKVPPFNRLNHIEVEDRGDSDNESDLEESEVEPVWSDVEYS